MVDWRGFGWAALLLFGLVTVADLLVWGLTARLGWVVLALMVAAGAQAMARPALSPGRLGLAWGVLVLCLLPILEEAQVLSMLFALMGLALFVGLVVASGRQAVWRAAGRFALFGMGQTGRDLAALPDVVRDPKAVQRQALGAARDWALPMGLGAVFVALFASANPVLDDWITTALNWDPGVTLDGGRVMFWLGMAVLVWPFLRLTPLAPRLTRDPSRRDRTLSLPRGLVHARSVMRALVTFNLIFAMQTVMDGSYLWGGLALPEGMSHAEYAHRGAYPLLVTALLAGAFALIAQPFLRGQRGLAALLYLWVGQTVLLVASSILRLDLYVDAYGLTRLRFAAFVWMGLVGWGLCLMIGQMAWRRSVGWLYAASALSGLVTLYLCCFVNVAGLIAGYNLSRPGLDQDSWYICGLGAGAAPEISAHEAKTGQTYCVYTSAPVVVPPHDLREWGYRNWRLRRSLAETGAPVFNGSLLERERD